MYSQHYPTNLEGRKWIPSSRIFCIHTVSALVTVGFKLDNSQKMQILIFQKICSKLSEHDPTIIDVLREFRVFQLQGGSAWILFRLGQRTKVIGQSILDPTPDLFNSMWIPPLHDTHFYFLLSTEWNISKNGLNYTY